MRKCRECGKEQRKEDFPKAQEVKGVVYYRHICKECHRDQKRLLRDSKRKDYIEFKKTLECNRCGYDDHRALEFHHHKADKEFNISEKFYQLSWENLKKEIDKCEVLCSNCHRIEHYNDGS